MTEINVIEDDVSKVARCLAFRNWAAQNGQQNSSETSEPPLQLFHFAGYLFFNALHTAYASDRDSVDITLDDAHPNSTQNQFVIRMGNPTAHVRYAYLFYLDAAAGISAYWPQRNIPNTLPPRGSISLGAGGSGISPLHISIPTGERWKAFQVIDEYLVVLLSTVPQNLEWLTQPAQDDPVMLTVADPYAVGHLPVYGDTQNRLDAIRASCQVAIIKLNIKRSSPHYPLPSGVTRLALREGISIQKPALLKGRLTLRHESAARKANSLPITVNPQHRERGTRDAFEEITMFTLEVDPSSTENISANTPLIIELTQPAADDKADIEMGGLVAIAFDGEDHILIGASSPEKPHQVTIAFVPLPPENPSEQPHEETRGLMQWMQFGLYRGLGVQVSTQQLRHVGWKENTAEYTQIKQAHFRAGDSVALFIHGFSSHTGWMARDLIAWLEASHVGYTHYLAFDYESIGVGVETHASTMADLLKEACGFKPEDQIRVDVFAHSMGCLVARSLVEQHGASAWVDRLVLLGPPNQGTVLASDSRGLVFVISQTLNLAEDSIAWLGIVGNHIYESSPGWSDLSPASEFLRSLQPTDSMQSVPYLLLAGDNSQYPDTKQISERLRKKILHGVDDLVDKYFEEENDLVVPMSSLMGITQPASQTVRVPCHHFNYLLDDNVRAVILNFLAQGRP